MAMKVSPPSIVLWKFDLTESKKNLPKMLAIVGISSAPHRTLVAEKGSLSGGRSLPALVKLGFTSILNKH